jgi:hypothetical protein
MAASRCLLIPVLGANDELNQLFHTVKFLGDFPPELIAASSPFWNNYFETDGYVV